MKNLSRNKYDLFTDDIVWNVNVLPIEIFLLFYV